MIVLTYITKKFFEELLEKPLDEKKYEHINFLIKNKCKRIILGCTELPIAIFAFKSIETVKSSKIFSLKFF